MAYLNLVEYDEGGRIQSLDGMAEVSYDDGRQRNLLGAYLGAVKYDDGGRFRTLIGLGQDLPADMPPPDVGIDTSILQPSFPISYTPASPAPSVLPFVPSPVVDVTSTPVTASLIPPTPGTPPPASAGTLVSVAAPTASALTSIFNSIKNVFSGAPAAKPIVAGQVVATGPGGPVGASWFSQGTMVSGLPNWGVLAGIALIGTILVVSLSSGGGSRRRNPGLFSGFRAYRTYRSHGARRGEAAREAMRHTAGWKRNPAELILMGANPRRRRRAR